MIHAGTYGAVIHYLKAVAAASSKPIVAAKPQKPLFVCISVSPPAKAKSEPHAMNTPCARRKNMF